MERQGSASQRSHGELRSALSNKETVGVDRAFLRSKVNDIRERLQELESGSFLEQIARIERMATFSAEHADALSLKCWLLSVEVGRLGGCLVASEARIQLVETELHREQDAMQNEVEALRARCVERERQLLQVSDQLEETAKTAKRERVEMMSKLSEKEAVERELTTRFGLLVAETKTLRGGLARAEEEAATQRKRATEAEQTGADRVAAAEQFHRDRLQAAEAEMRVQWESRLAEAVEGRRREDERERQRQSESFRVQLAARESEVVTKSRENSDLEDRIRQLREETGRLNSALAAAHAAVEDREAELQARDSQLSLRLSAAEEMAESEKSALQQRLHASYKATMDGLAAQHEADLKALRKKLIDAENGASFLVKEKTFLEANLTEARLEADRLRGEVLGLRDEFEEEFESMAQQIETYRNTFIDPKELEVRFRAERSSYDAQIVQLNNKIFELNCQVANLTDDNKRLNLQALERLQEIERFRNVHSLGPDTGESAQLKKKVSDLRGEVDALQEKLVRATSEKNQISARLRGTESDIEIVRSECADIRELLNQKRAELSEVNEELSRARRAAGEAMAEKMKMSGDLLMLEEKNQTYMAGYETLIKERDHYKRAYESNDLEHAITNKQLVEKIREVDEIRQRYEEALSNFDHKNSWNFSKKSQTIQRKGVSPKDDFSHLS